MDTFQLSTWAKRKKASLGGPNLRDVLLFLVFLLFSSLCWVVITLNEVHESTVSVELKLVDVPSDVLVTDSLPTTVQVQVQDRGMAFLHYWMRGVKPIEISFARYASTREGRVKVPLSDVQKALQKNLLENSKIVRFSPDSLDFWYNHGQSKMVPLVVDGTVTAGDGRYVMEQNISPKEVKVYAPKPILDTLTAVYTMPTTLVGLQQSATEQLKLRPIHGVKMEVDRVKVDATVDVLVENTVSVPILVDGLPEGVTVRLFPVSEAKVVYSACYSDSKSIEDGDFAIRLTYNQIQQHQLQGKDKVLLRLSKKPAAVVSTYLEPEMVEYLVEKTDSIGLWQSE